jgi:hypothetical protein
MNVLGWDVFVERPQMALADPNDPRLRDEVENRPSEDPRTGVGPRDRLVSSEADVCGLRFLDELVTNGAAVELRGMAIPRSFSLEPAL